MLMIKGYWVYGANFDTLGAGSQNDNSPATVKKKNILHPHTSHIIYCCRLWHQLTVALLEFVKQPLFQDKLDALINFDSNLITEIESK